MNIVKIYNTYAPEGIDTTIFDYVNGKYCYLINWKWIVPFEYTVVDPETKEEQTFSFSKEDYIECSTNDHAPAEYPFAGYADYLIHNLIDPDLTEKANSIVKFVEANKFTPDDDITIEELKNFRTWLAERLYAFLSEDPQVYGFDIMEMLNYYIQHMYDDTVRHLTTFTPKTSVDILTATNRSTCGCQGATGLSILGAGVSVCDPIYIYRKSVYEKMVDIFSNVQFWTDREKLFLIEFKKYIDGIIKLNFPLYTVDYVSDLYDCGCLSDADSSQERLMGYLKNLSKSLEYIINDDMTSHKNFIGDSFNKWAVYLYEKMQWV